MRIKIAIAFAFIVGSHANGQGAPIRFSANVAFETGDTWSHEGQKYRLFGVQSCIRGANFRSPEGADKDCGLSSLASLAALFSEGTIGCQPIGTTKEGATFVVCAADLDGGMVDVGTALISAGAAFAGTLPSGEPVLTAYAVAELAAKESRSGLWAGSFDHPTVLLAGAAIIKD